MLTTRSASLALVTAAIVLGLTLLGVALAHADEVGGLAESMFDRLDANRDGIVTRDEVEAARGRVFDRLDADHDGAASAAEIEAAREAARKRGMKRLSRVADLRANMASPSERFEAMDLDKDGKLSRQEFVGASPWFDRISKNGGSLSKADFSRFLDAAQ